MGIVAELWEDYGPLFIIVLLILIFVGAFVVVGKQEDKKLARACAEANAIAKTSADRIAAIRICYDLDEPKTTIVPQAVYVR